MGIDADTGASSLETCIEAIVRQHDFECHLRFIKNKFNRLSREPKLELKDGSLEYRIKKLAELQAVFVKSRQEYIGKIKEWGGSAEAAEANFMGETPPKHHSIPALYERIDSLKLLLLNQSYLVPGPLSQLVAQIKYDQLFDKEKDTIWDSYWTPESRLSFYSAFAIIIAIETIHHSPEDDGAAGFMRRTFVTICNAVYDHVVGPCLNVVPLDSSVGTPSDTNAAVAFPEEVWDTPKKLSATTLNYKADLSAILVVAARPRGSNRTAEEDGAPANRPRTTAVAASRMPRIDGRGGGR